MAKTTVRVALLGNDGNAFFILGSVKRALEKAGYSDLAKQYMKEATASDYNQLLAVTQEYVEVC